MTNRECYYYPHCGGYSYRIPLYSHGDGQLDTDDNPVYLLADAGEMTADELEHATESACGCTD